MKSDARKPRKLSFINPDRHWVVSKLDQLIEEWREWQSAVAQIQDRPFDANSQSGVYADGADNMKRHAILQEKTLTLLDQTIEGHNFIYGFDGDHIDRIALRLKVRAEHRLNDLDVLRACVANTSDLTSEQIEWVRASEAIAMLEPVLPEIPARVRICERAHGGMVRARAEQFHHGQRIFLNHDIPREFWWAEGHQALEQDWVAGDFSTWIDRGSAQLKAFGVTFDRATIQKLVPPGSAKIELTSEDNEIADILGAHVPSAALSYRQAILDLGDDRRISFRGSALELREALREILDYLAPDSKVTSTPGYVQEKDRNGPTMKQKVRFIMKEKGNQSSSDAPEQAATAFEESIAALTRAVYERSSKATHVGGDRKTVRQLRRYVVTIFHDILKT